VRVRRRDLGIGAASAFRPAESQLISVEQMEEDRYLPCRMATFRRIMVEELECRLISAWNIFEVKLIALVRLRMRHAVLGCGANHHRQQTLAPRFSCNHISLS
jgi:hypothetical protein